jgi:flagellar transcriptional activator FlhC
MLWKRFVQLQIIKISISISFQRGGDISGHSPSKGMLPYSTDWFMSWQPNIHASLFLGIYRYLDKTIALPALELLIKSYRLYL